MMDSVLGNVRKKVVRDSRGPAMLIWAQEHQYLRGTQFDQAAEVRSLVNYIDVSGRRVLYLLSAINDIAIKFARPN